MKTRMTAGRGLRRHGGHLLAVVTAALVLPPAGAQAFTIGNGSHPAVTVDQAGTAYIVWSGAESPRTLRFCRLPRGAKACEVTRTIPAPGDSNTSNFVFFSGNRIVVVSGRYGAGVAGFSASYSFLSSDRGTTFDAGRVIGSVRFHDATAGPGGTITGATDVAKGAFQNVSIEGGTVGGSMTFSSDQAGDYTYLGTTGLADAGTPVVVFANGSGRGQFRRYNGGPINEIASWSPPADLGLVGDPHLADGPRGLFLQSDLASITVRRWTGSGFGAPVVVGEGVSHSTLFQDAGGRLHSIFANKDIVHAVSDDGAKWRSAPIVTQPDGTTSYLRGAAAPDHNGVLVYTGGARNEVRVVRFGAKVSGASSPRLQAARVLRKPEGVYRVSGLPTCVDDGDTFTVSARYEPNSRRERESTAFRHIDFTFRGRRVARVRKPTFRAKFLAGDVAAGRRYPVRVTFSRKAAPSTARSITGSVPAC